MVIAGACYETLVQPVVIRFVLCSFCLPRNERDELSKTFVSLSDATRSVFLLTETQRVHDFRVEEPPRTRHVFTSILVELVGRGGSRALWIASTHGRKPYPSSSSGRSKTRTSTVASKHGSRPETAKNTTTGNSVSPLFRRSNGRRELEYRRRVRTKTKMNL